MAFGFHAEYVASGDVELCLSFADWNDADWNEKEAKHYFVMMRSEESPEEAVPDMQNVYIERDDQCWGGYGGIERIVLERDSLAVHLAPRMATRMGQHDEIHVSFTINDADFHELRHVLHLIMRGYEDKLECRA
jgi:hypothetical protein